MNLLFLGDVVGGAGCAAVRKHLPTLKRKYQIDFTVVNGENSADGNGILPGSADALLVWTRATGIRFFFASCATLRTILCDTVPINRISRSGFPIFFRKEPFSFVNTFALHPCSLQIVS